MFIAANIAPKSPLCTLCPSCCPPMPPPLIPPKPPSNHLLPTSPSHHLLPSSPPNSPSHQLPFFFFLLKTPIKVINPWGGRIRASLALFIPHLGKFARCHTSSSQRMLRSRCTVRIVRVTWVSRQYKAGQKMERNIRSLMYYYLPHRALRAFRLVQAKRDL